MATATWGEHGMLGTHGQVVTREDLPGVREAELRTVLHMYGAKPPSFWAIAIGKCRTPTLMR